MTAAPGILNLNAIGRAQAQNSPYTYFIARDCVAAEAREALRRDFPVIDAPGSIPVDTLQFGPAFAALLDVLRAPSFSEIIGGQLELDLSPYPQLITVRGHARGHDGRVHTDATWKVATVLIYLNDDWTQPGGRLRVLASGDLNDIAAEVPPEFGSLLAFRRCDRSFHGHEPFEGERRVVQINWISRQEKLDREIRRLKRSARLKRLFPFLSGWGY